MTWHGLILPVAASDDTKLESLATCLVLDDETAIDLV